MFVCVHEVMIDTMHFKCGIARVHVQMELVIVWGGGIVVVWDFVGNCLCFEKYLLFDIE